MSKRNLALIAATLVSVIYGLTFTVAKDVMPEFVKPFGFILMRVGGSVLLFWAIAFLGPKEKICLGRFPENHRGSFVWRVGQYVDVLQRVEYDFADFRFGDYGYDADYCVGFVFDHHQGKNEAAQNLRDFFRLGRHCFFDSFREVNWECTECRTRKFIGFHQCGFLWILSDCR